MKRILLLTGMFILAVTLVACGNNDNNNSGTDQNDDVTNNEDQNNNANNQGNDSDTNSKEGNNADGDLKQKMDKIDYTDFELEVDYGKNKEYEAGIEQDNSKNGGIEADLEDEINGLDLNGEEAFNKIYPNVKKLTIDQKTAKEDAIKETLKAFDLKDNYVKFDMEITFKDGTKIEFEDNK